MGQQKQGKNEVMEGTEKVRSDFWERTGKGPSFGGWTVPNMGSGGSTSEPCRMVFKGNGARKGDRN